MSRDYVTTEHLDEIIERVAASVSRIDELHRQAAHAAHAEHERARHGDGAQEGGNT